MDYGDGRRIEWTYSAGGAKLRKTVYESYNMTYFKDYVGGFVYRKNIDEDTKLDFITTSEGRIKTRTDGSFYNIYDLKDHLGNVRVSYIESTSGVAEVVQEDHYYPFGMRLSGLNTANDDNKFL
ncbi:MAG: hypothetical protein K8S23_15205 [Candidatus Cloacimonetes bacterium]|nr:hypothetical protein [Candidatus Cloacimonadota bacterium]